MIFKGDKRIFENAIEESITSTPIVRKLEIVGVDSFTSDSIYHNVLIDIISLNNGVASNTTLQINDDDPKPIYFLINSEDTTSPDYENWVYKNQVYTVYFNSILDAFICIPPNPKSSEDVQVTSDNIISALGYTPAELDDNGKVLSSQLPSYVDDVLEFDSEDDFPSVGESGIIYISISSNKCYRWSGTMYVEISESLALGETSSTAFDGARGKIAYDHSQSTGNPHNTTKADIGLGNVDNTADADKKVSEAGKVSHYLTIQKNGNTVITYNGSLEKIANITVPTKTSELINDSDFVGSTGTIDVAKKVGTTTVGGSTTPVYINEGIPTAIGYSIAKSVPADAVFTDTTYSNATQSKAGLMSALDKTKLDSISDDLTIPTKLSELTNDSNFIASTELSGSDLNNVLTPGFYYGAYEANNKPTGSRITFGLKVYKIAAHTAQEFINAVDLRTWIRYYNNSSWSSWTERLFTDTTYNEATTSADGLMSFEDKSKLNGIAIGATRLTGSTFTVGLNVINKVITPGDSTTLDYDITNFTASQVSNGLMSAADKIKLDGIESNTNTSINGEFIKYNVSEGSEITEYVSVEMFNKISAGYSIDYTSTLGTGYNRMILSTRRYTSGTIETLIMVLASDNIYSSIPLTEIAFSIDSDYDSDVVFLGANGPYSGGGGEACFTGDTLVLTDNGLKPIEEIKVNDLVMSYNFETKEQELKPVVAIISHNTKYVYNVISENNVIKATGDHPVHSNEYGKINVSQLTSNCSLLMHNNIKDSIININMEEKSCVVYDLSVQDNHTYYVGYKPVLVYNESITNIYN